MVKLDILKIIFFLVDSVHLVSMFPQAPPGGTVSQTFLVCDNLDDFEEDWSGIL